MPVVLSDFRVDGSEAWLDELSCTATRWREGDIEPAVFAAFYFFHWQMATHRDAFASRRRKSDQRPMVWTTTLATMDGRALREQLLDCLDRYQFRGVIANVPVALGQWLRGVWRMELREDMPSPREVLRAQARGTRQITAITASPRLFEPVLNKRDAFAFFLHDVEHAFKFFYSPALYAGQWAFFAALEAALDRGVFTPYFDDPAFVEKFHYLIGDMNTHPQHGWQYLRAILIEFHLRAEGKASTAPLSMRAERAIDDAMYFIRGNF
jgi:hypothetical protein